jgi:predicted nucleic-acid-binding Zn-ribbon protein
MNNHIKCPSCKNTDMVLITATAIGDPTKKNNIKMFGIYYCPECKKSKSITAVGNFAFTHFLDKPETK